MKFSASEVYALIHIPSSRFYDISFKLQCDLDLFWSLYNDTRDEKIWDDLHCIQLSKPREITATVLFQSEVVALADLQHWLSRQCMVRSHPEKIYDEEQIWNGGYTVKIQLFQESGVTRHLPHSFYLGSERGICYYPGQPRLCHRCGGRHLAMNCSRIKCSLCGQFGHAKYECTAPVVCNLCSEPGHTFRECLHAEHNKNNGQISIEVMEQDREDVTKGPDDVPEARAEEERSHKISKPVPESEVSSMDSAIQGPPATEKRPEVPPATVGRPKVPPATEERPKVPPATEERPKVPPTTVGRPKVPPATVERPKVPPATEERPKKLSLRPEIQVSKKSCKVSRKPAAAPSRHQPNTSAESANPAAVFSEDKDGFMTVKRKNAAADPSRKVTTAQKSSEPSAQVISPGHYNVLGEDEQEEAQMEQSPSCIPDSDSHEDDPDPPVSTKRWGTTGHSSGRRKKSRKSK